MFQIFLHGTVGVEKKICCLYCIHSKWRQVIGSLFNVLRCMLTRSPPSPREKAEIDSKNHNHMTRSSVGSMCETASNASPDRRDNVSVQTSPSTAFSSMNNAGQQSPVSPGKIRRHKRQISTDITVPPPGKRIHSLQSHGLTLPALPSQFDGLTKSNSLGQLSSAPLRLDTHLEVPDSMGPPRSFQGDTMAVAMPTMDSLSMQSADDDSKRSQDTKENHSVLLPPPSSMSLPSANMFGGGRGSGSVPGSRSDSVSGSAVEEKSASPVGGTVGIALPGLSSENVSPATGPGMMVAPTTISSTSVYSRRHAHILSEQKRRENINGGFKQLKNAVPFCKGTQDSKATILKKAVDYIATLEHEVSALRYSSVGPLVGPSTHRQQGPGDPTMSQPPPPPPHLTNPHSSITPPHLNPASHVIHNLRSASVNRPPAPPISSMPHSLPPTPPPPSAPQQQQHGQTPVHIPHPNQPLQYFQPPQFHQQKQPQQQQPNVGQRYTTLPNLATTVGGPPSMGTPGPILPTLTGPITARPPYYPSEISRASSTPPITGRFNSKRNFSLPPDYVPAGRYTPPPSMGFPPRQL